eukprot:10944288-Ditylum_brightwellii.AAC.1
MSMVTFDVEGFVLQMFMHCWFKCPLTVATLLYKCFCMLRSSMPGYVAKKPRWTAFHHVDLTGLKHAA